MHSRENYSMKINYSVTLVDSLRVLSEIRQSNWFCHCCLFVDRAIFFIFGLKCTLVCNPLECLLKQLDYEPEFLRLVV